MPTPVASPQPTIAPPQRYFSYWQRRIVRHLTIAFITLAGTALFLRLFSARRDLLSHLSIATAYPALFLTAAAGFFGPREVPGRPPHPLNFGLRPRIGLFGGSH